MATSENTIGSVRWLGTVPGKTGRTICLVLLFAALPLLLPRLQRPLSWKGQDYKAMLPDVHELIAFKSNRSAPEVMGPSTAQTTDAPTARDPSDPCAAGLIDDPARALDHFYAALANTEAKKFGAITRITHYGDSPITNDGITGTARRLLQERFGDAGHGFILVDRPWEWYGHQAITFTSSGGLARDSFLKPMTKDGKFGLRGGDFYQAAGQTGRFRSGPPRRN